MRYGANRADVFATSAENNAGVRRYYCFLLAFFLFNFEGTHMAEIDAFTAGYAFIIVDFWIPRYFVTWDSFIIFFGHIVVSLLL